MATRKSSTETRRTSAGTTNLAHLKTEGVGDFVKRSMYIYGSEVNEDRAIPSLQDGFKPVQRRLVWAAGKVATGKVKSALPVAEAMGKYHPHSDSSLYGSLVTMVNSNVPVMIGLGGWGSLIDPASAMRYTNTLLSKYGNSFLQKEYLAVTPKVPNYDSTLEEPLYLPALLPNIFLNPTSGIGVGIRTELPAYTPDSLLTMCIRLLDREDLAPIDWVKGLEFWYPWGAKLVKTRANMLALKTFYEGSSGSVSFYAPVVLDESSKTISITNFVSGVRLESSDKKRNEKTSVGANSKDTGLGAIDRIRKMLIVDSVYTNGGLSYVVQIKKTANLNECKALHAKIQEMFTAKQSFNIFVTERMPDVDGKYKVQFHNCSVPEVLIKWLKFRLRLEVNSLNWRIGEQEKAIAYTELLIHACANLEVIFTALKKRLSKEDLCKALMRGLKVSEVEAKTVMELRVHQLSKLDQDMLEQKLKEQQKHLRELQRDVKAPVRVVRAYLADMVTKFKQFNGTNPQQKQFVIT